MKGQLKKLFYNKKLVDTPGGEPSAEWRISPWKVFVMLITAMILLIIFYAYVATPSPSYFLGNMIFYGIVIIGAVAVLWVLGATIYKGRKLITGFFIAFILILTFYWLLGFILGTFLVLNFHMGGYSLWIMITILAGLGAKRIDGSLDKSDVGYGLLILIVCIGANIPISNEQGFLWNLDNLIESVLCYSENIRTLLGFIL
jgi:hypothetical protein